MVDTKVSIMESLTEDDIVELSKFSLTEDEISHIVSLFELISEENKDKAFDIIKSLFEGKKLVTDENNKEIEENLKNSAEVSSYTRKLLGDN